MDYNRLIVVAHAKITTKQPPKRLAVQLGQRDVFTKLQRVFAACPDNDAVAALATTPVPVPAVPVPSGASSPTPGHDGCAVVNDDDDDAQRPPARTRRIRAVSHRPAPIAETTPCCPGAPRKPAMCKRRRSVVCPARSVRPRTLAMVA